MIVDIAIVDKILLLSNTNLSTDFRGLPFHGRELHLSISVHIYLSSKFYSFNIMAEGFRSMPLGLVTLRTFRLSARVYLGATLTQVFTRAGGADVSLRDVTIALMGNGCYRVRVMWRTGSARRIWGILKKSVELSLVRRRKMTFACSPRPWVGVARDWGRQMKKLE